jgi:hypothetical protein
LCASDGFAGRFDGVWPGEGAIGDATHCRSGRHCRSDREAGGGELHVELVESVEQTSAERGEYVACIASRHDKLRPHVWVSHRHKMLRMNHTKLKWRSWILRCRDPGVIRSVWNVNLAETQPRSFR